jgi:murein DD-endopeptidase MepM/ murein hydrolase activator NlpD
MHWPLMLAGTLGLLLLGMTATPSTTGGHYSSPIRGKPILSSRFGWRQDPLTGQRSFHEGLDLAVPVGTPIYAPAAGLVELVHRDGVGPGRFNGNAVFLRTADGRRWAFLHLSSVALSPGSRVRAGALLGLSGSTGRSTGPHLHIQVWERNGALLDPAWLLGWSSI